jgi:hypothetical protein
MAKQAKLMRVADDARVRNLTAQLERHQADLPDRKARLDNANRALEAAQDEVDRVERGVLAGRATDKDLAAAQNHLAECKTAQAVAFHDHADIARLVGVLPAALEEAKQAALVEVVANLRDAYGVALADLRAKLLAAKEASDAVQRLFNQAYAEVPCAGVHPRFHCAVTDLGAGGLTTAAARLPDLSLSELTPLYRNQPTRLDGWLKECDALLAELPRMAEADKQHRVMHDSFEAQQAVIERQKEANYAAMLRRDLERAGVIMP